MRPSRSSGSSAAGASGCAPSIRRLLRDDVVGQARLTRRSLERGARIAAYARDIRDRLDALSALDELCEVRAELGTARRSGRTLRISLCPDDEVEI